MVVAALVVPAAKAPEWVVAAVEAVLERVIERKVSIRAYRY
jgi:hypothetical protein